MESRNVEKIRLFDFGRTYGQGYSLSCIILYIVYNIVFMLGLRPSIKKAWKSSIFKPKQNF